MNQHRTFCLITAALVGLVTLLPRPAIAAWPTDPAVNLPVSTATGDQNAPSMTADGAGGAIITWYDTRGADWDIYVQKITSGGAVAWTIDGTGICVAAKGQAISRAVSDGAGGAIVSWLDDRTVGGNPGIYAQRILANGTVAWAANGVAVSTGDYTHGAPSIAADGFGGAVIAWNDFRTGATNIYAQRIASGGGAVWTPNGVPVCTADGVQSLAMVAADGAGGGIVTWQDNRAYNYDVYAQRLSSGGGAMWTANGNALCSNTGFQYSPIIVPDGANGAVVAWEDERSGVRNIYAQRVSGDGVAQWAADGVRMATSTRAQQHPALATDGAHGAIVTWEASTGYGVDLYAQQVTAAGALSWGTTGLGVCTSSSAQTGPAIAADGANGAIISWYDDRSGYANSDVYAQRVSAAGVNQWTVGGVALCISQGNQTYPAIVPDGAHGAIVSWQDRRGTTNDVYAQRVQASGTLGGDVVSVPAEAPHALALEPVSPNPARGGALSVQFSLAGDGPATLELLDVAGRRIASRDVGVFGAGRHTVNLGEGVHVAPGVYLVSLRQGLERRVTRAAMLE